MLTAENGGLIFVSLPKNQEVQIRENLKGA
jgi:hypothetical protein